MDLTVWALRRRKSNIIDRWDGHRYTRIIVAENDPIKVTAHQEGPPGDPEIVIILQSENGIDLKLQNDIDLLVNKMLGLTIDLRPFYKLADANDLLRPLAAQFSGLRPPRFSGLFEALLNAIACQQITLDVGLLVLNRLAERFGKRFEDEDGIFHAFPRPEDLKDVPEGDIKSLGFSHNKAMAIKGLASDILDEGVDLGKLENMNDREAVEYLSRIRGIGRWSAEYALLRGLGRLDSFPGDDIGAQNNLKRLFRLDHKAGYDEIKALTSAWHPYEGLVYFHLLLENLHRKGLI